MSRWKPVWKRNPAGSPRPWRRIGWQRDSVPFYSRNDWGADPSDLLERMPAGTWRNATLVVHHTVTKRAATQDAGGGIAAVRQVQTVHASNAGGIGYGYLASGGCLFEGRGYEVVAAAAFNSATGQGWNRGPYVHVSIPGNYAHAPIHPTDLVAIDDLIVYLRKRGCKITGIIGHGDLMPTACPGKRGRADLAAHFGKRWKGAR